MKSINEYHPNIDLDDDHLFGQIEDYMDNMDAILSYKGQAYLQNHETQSTMADKKSVSNDGDINTGSGSFHHAPSGI